MSIKILRQSAKTNDLTKVGPIPSALSKPASEISKLELPITSAADNAAGLWESTPGKFSRQVAKGEIMHILSGSCTFTPEGESSALEINAGDSLFFPPNTKGVWDIKETMRKLYVLV